jgi:hypothetical protein
MVKLNSTISWLEELHRGLTLGDAAGDGVRLTAANSLAKTAASPPIATTSVPLFIFISFIR